MEVQVTLHISHLSVPEVEFTTLLLIVLLHERHSPLQFFRGLVFGTQLSFQVLDSLHAGLLVSIESGAETLSSIFLLLRLNTFNLKLLQLVVNGLLLNRGMLKS